MKNCSRCGSVWQGYGNQPRPREVCEGCGAYLRICLSCHHFDRRASACTEKESSFIGSRTALNYCEFFKMADTVVKEREARTDRALSRWEALFER